MARGRLQHGQGEVVARVLAQLTDAVRAEGVAASGANDILRRDRLEADRARELFGLVVRVFVARCEGRNKSSSSPIGIDSTSLLASAIRNDPRRV